MTTARAVAFGPLTIAYDDRVLTPRPWTALQSRWAAELAAGEGDDGVLLELCSGAGHIGLLASHLSGRPLVAVDIDPVACEVMAANADAAGLTERVEIRNAPLASALAPGERYAVAIADPPWVASAAIERFPDDPTLAIDGGDDGLDLARACVEACRDHLVTGGSLLVQVGDAEQAAALVAGLDADGPWTAGELRHGGEGESRGVVQELVHA